MSKGKTINSLHYGAKAHLDLELERGKWKSLWFEIPSDCHLKCDYCFAKDSLEIVKKKKSSESHDKRRSILPTTKNTLDKVLIFRLLDEFKNAGGEFIGIPGKGEPFIKENRDLVIDIITKCKDLGLKLTLFTTIDQLFINVDNYYAGIENHLYSGIKTNDEHFPEIDHVLIDLLKANDHVILLVKTNSLKEEVQDKLVNKPGYTRLRNRMLEHLCNEGFNKQNRLGIVTSIMEENKDEIIELYEYAKNYQLIFDCDTILPKGKGYDFESKSKLKPAEIRKTYENLKNKGAISHNPTGTYVGAACDRVKHHLYIDLYGNIFPCIGCSNTLKNDLCLGNVFSDIDISDINEKLFLNKGKRKLLANHYDQVFTGVCPRCENFKNETCFSCFGRSVIKFIEPEKDSPDTIVVETGGCSNHMPDFNSWLLATDEYLRSILGEQEIQALFKLDWENLWLPNRNISFRLSHVDDAGRSKELRLIVNDKKDPHAKSNKRALHNQQMDKSDTDSFSWKKHYSYSDLTFPLNQVWEFVKDPRQHFNEFLNTEIKTRKKRKSAKKTLHHIFTKSTLSNVMLPSMKMLLEQNDKNGNLLLANLLLYDNLNEKYFYRTFCKNDLDVTHPNRYSHAQSDFSDKYFAALVLFRLAEKFRDGKSCFDDIFNLSNIFRKEVFSDYELVFSENTQLRPAQQYSSSIERKHITLFMSELMNTCSIQKKVQTIIKAINNAKPGEKEYLISLLNEKSFKHLETDSVPNEERDIDHGPKKLKVFIKFLFSIKDVFSSEFTFEQEELSDLHESLIGFLKANLNDEDETFFNHLLISKNAEELFERVKYCKGLTNLREIIHSNKDKRTFCNELTNYYSQKDAERLKNEIMDIDMNDHDFELQLDHLNEIIRSINDRVHTKKPFFDLILQFEYQDNEQKSRKKALNYLVYLNLMKALGIDYYYIYHTTTFSDKEGDVRKQVGKLKSISPSGILVCSKNRMTEIQKGNIKLMISNLLSPFEEKYNLYELDDANQKLRNESVKSAIAAIMGRNGSHNLGSHVLSAVSHNYNNPRDMQLLFTYLQHRMDFIAQITSHWPSWNATLPLMKFIMRNFYMQRLMLNYIVHSEGLNAYEYKPASLFENGNFSKAQSNKLILKVGHLETEGFHENKSNKLLIKEDKIEWLIKEREDFDEEKLKKDINLAIPGGMVGTHAFYSILENFIRNVAKHDWAKTSADHLEICLLFSDNIEKNCVDFLLYSRIIETIEQTQSNNKSGFQVIKTDFKDIKKTVKHINTDLDMSLLDSNNGGNRKHSLGIAEIKICAGYLNRIPIDTLEPFREQRQPDKNGNIIIAKIIGFTKGNSPVKYHWAYSFSIPKPKLVLFVGFENQKCSSEIKFIKSIKKEDECDFEAVVFKKEAFQTYIQDKEVNSNTITLRAHISNLPIRTMVLGSADYLQMDSENIRNLKKWVQFVDEKILSETDIQSMDGDNLNVEKTYYNVRKIFAQSYSNNKQCNIKIIPYENAIAGGVETLKEFNTFYRSFFNEYNNSIIETDGNSYVIKRKPLHELDIANEQDIISQSFYYLKRGVEKLYTKYDEAIETLPNIYSIENKERNCETASTEIVEYSKTHFDKDPKSIFEIKFKRHTNLSAEEFEYIETLSGAQSYFLELLETVQNIDNDNTIDFDVCETALTGIYIIDERVAEYYAGLNDTIKKRFSNIKVKVVELPKKEKEKYSNEKSQNKSEKRVQALTYFDEIELIDDSYIVIVHLGILDKIPRFTDKEKKEKMEILTKLAKKRFVFITSGRAPDMTDYIGTGFRFLPISEITNTIQNQYPEKLLLTRIIMKTINPK